MINKVILVGNVGQEPEIVNFDNGGSIVKFTLATTKIYKDKNEQVQKKIAWHNIKVTGAGLQSTCLSHVKKGMLLYIEGSIEVNENKKGDKFVNIVLNTYDSTLKILKFQSDENKPATQQTQQNVGAAGLDLDDDMPF